MHRRGSLLAWALIALSSLALAAETAAPSTPLPKTVSSKQLAELLSRPESRLILLDVRSLTEFEEGHIPGAVLMPYTLVETEFVEPDKGRPIVLYCRSGRRSALALDSLKSMGYTNVRDFGAVTNWLGSLVKGR
jgi:rhodanese-related sulfurtransferase